MDKEHQEQLEQAIRLAASVIIGKMVPAAAPAGFAECVRRAIVDLQEALRLLEEPTAEGITTVPQQAVTPQQPQAVELPSFGTAPVAAEPEKKKPWWRRALPLAAAIGVGLIPGGTMVEAGVKAVIAAIPGAQAALPAVTGDTLADIALGLGTYVLGAKLVETKPKE